MAVIMDAFWDNAGTIIPSGSAEYLVNCQPISEYDNWILYTIVADIQAVIDDVINKYNANTILKADADNTPIALAISEQTIVGRKTGGSIDALTVAEVLTMLSVDSGAEVNLFEDSSSVIREKSGGYDRDFIIGSPQLADDSDPAHDRRFWFDKSKGAFRAGEATGTEWNDSSVGVESIAMGYNTIASGFGACAIGYEATSSGDYSFAEGRGTQATNAGGSYANHAEGNNTVASGTAAHAEGSATEASANYAHAEGIESSAYLLAQYAKASGEFSVAGDAQYSNVVLRCATTTASTTEMTLTGGAPLGNSRVILPANRTWMFTISIAARQTAGTGTVGDSGIYKIEGGIKRDGSNNTVLVGSITKTVLGEDQPTWDVTAEADNTNECLVIKVNGEASKTIHWVAKADLVEVG